MLLMAEREHYGGTVSQEYQRTRVNIAQACALAGVSRRSIYNWIAAGKVEYVRTAGGAIRIYVDTLLKRPPDD